MSTQTTTEEQTWCVWCRQAMTPDPHGDWITCPNAGDACIDCCPCCDTWPPAPEPDPDPLRGDPYAADVQALRALIGAHPIRQPQ